MAAKRLGGDIVPTAASHAAARRGSTSTAVKNTFQVEPRELGAAPSEAFPRPVPVFPFTAPEPPLGAAAI